MCPGGLEMIWERDGRKSIVPGSLEVRERILWLQRWISFKGQRRKRKSKGRRESNETKARGAYGGGHTFVTIDLFTG
jgi:hypothetical protein